MKDLIKAPAVALFSIFSILAAKSSAQRALSIYKNGFKGSLKHIEAARRKRAYFNKVVGNDEFIEVENKGEEIYNAFIPNLIVGLVLTITMASPLVTSQIEKLGTMAVSYLTHMDGYPPSEPMKLLIYLVAIATPYFIAFTWYYKLVKRTNNPLPKQDYSGKRMYTPEEYISQVDINAAKFTAAEMVEESIRQSKKLKEAAEYQLEKVKVKTGMELICEMLGKEESEITEDDKEMIRRMSIDTYAKQGVYGSLFATDAIIEMA